MDTRQRRILIILLVVVSLFALYFLRDFISLIALGAIVAFVFNPVYKKLVKLLGGRTGWAATLTFLISIVTLAIPLAIILTITVDQALQIADDIRQAIASNNNFFKDIINLVNSGIDKLPGDVQRIDSAQIVNWLKENASSIFKSTASFLVSFAGGISMFLTKAIIYVFIFLSFLKNQEKIVNIVRKLNPFKEEVVDLYLSRTKAMTTAMVKGQFAIALLQGLFGAASLLIVGYPYFIFWWVFLTFLSFIPLGGGIILIPMGIILLITGNIWQGIFLIAVHLIITTNIDNVLRPRFVPKTARLDPALTILSVFAGIAMFGFLGIVIGPVLMILIVTTIQVYIGEMHPKDKAKDLKELKSIK
jgi:predicted PurR-regulated permease PerM